MNEDSIWTKTNTNLVGTKLGNFVPPKLIGWQQEVYDAAETEYDFYKIFQPDTFLKKTVYQSKLYATQKHLNNKLRLYFEIGISHFAPHLNIVIIV